MRPTKGWRGSYGFSLLEMMVAISILAISLVALYQAAMGATRNVRTGEKYAYGVELARSLLAVNSRVPLSGVREHGETSGRFKWRVESHPFMLEGNRLPAGALQEIEVVVSWTDGSKEREIVLNSIVEGVRP